MKDDPDEVDRVLEETKEYYRQRASQYSDWSRRTGVYEGGSEPDASWFDEARILLDALEAERLQGNVLEIASGTGIWTEVLTRTASSVNCPRLISGNDKEKHVKTQGKSEGEIRSCRLLRLDPGPGL